MGLESTTFCMAGDPRYPTRGAYRRQAAYPLRPRQRRERHERPAGDAQG